MPKLKTVNESVDAILNGIQEVVDHLEGKKQLKSESFCVSRQNPKDIRESMGLSQSEFSSRFGIPLATLQNWEQERRLPDQTSNALLCVIKHNPDAVWESMRASQSEEQSSF